METVYIETTIGRLGGCPLIGVAAALRAAGRCQTKSSRRFTLVRRGGEAPLHQKQISVHALPQLRVVEAHGDAERLAGEFLTPGALPADAGADAAHLAGVIVFENPCHSELARNLWNPFGASLRFLASSE
jgi:hypothetical protein